MSLNEFRNLTYEEILWLVIQKIPQFAKLYPGIPSQPLNLEFAKTVTIAKLIERINQIKYDAKRPVTCLTVISELVKVGKQVCFTEDMIVVDSIKIPIVENFFIPADSIAQINSDPRLKLISSTKSAILVAQRIVSSVIVTKKVAMPKTATPQFVSPYDRSLHDTYRQNIAAYVSLSGILERGMPENGRGMNLANSLLLKFSTMDPTELGEFGRAVWGFNLPPKPSPLVMIADFKYGSAEYAHFFLQDSRSLRGGDEKDSTLRGMSGYLPFPCSRSLAKSFIRFYDLMSIVKTSKLTFFNLVGDISSFIDTLIVFASSFVKCQFGVVQFNYPGFITSEHYAEHRCGLKLYEYDKNEVTINVQLNKDVNDKNKPNASKYAYMGPPNSYTIGFVCKDSTNRDFIPSIAVHSLVGFHYNPPLTHAVDGKVMPPEGLQLNYDMEDYLKLSVRVNYTRSYENFTTDIPYTVINKSNMGFFKVWPTAMQFFVAKVAQINTICTELSSGVTEFGEMVDFGSSQIIKAYETTTARIATPAVPQPATVDFESDGARVDAETSYNDDEPEVEVTEEVSSNQDSPQPNFVPVPGRSNGAKRGRGGAALRGRGVGNNLYRRAVEKENVSLSEAPFDMNNM